VRLLFVVAGLGQDGEVAEQDVDKKVTQQDVDREVAQLLELIRLSLLDVVVGLPRLLPLSPWTRQDFERDVVSHPPSSDVEREVAQQNVEREVAQLLELIHLSCDFGLMWSVSLSLTPVLMDSAICRKRCRAARC
jgi:uncharacterized membrane protein